MIPVVQRQSYHRRSIVAGSSSLLTNLIGYWKLDESSAGSSPVTRNDSAGTNHLTDNNTVASTTGKISNAASFIAANFEYLSHASNSDLQIGAGDLTIACWAKFATNTGVHQVVTKYSDASQEYAILTVPAFAFYSGSGSTNATHGTTPSTGTWYFLLAEFDHTAGTISISVNNGTPVTASGITPVTAGGAKFEIGARDGYEATAQTLDGAVDEVGIWKRLLTSGEKATLYNSGSGTTYPF